MFVSSLANRSIETRCVAIRDVKATSQPCSLATWRTGPAAKRSGLLAGRRERVACNAVSPTAYSYETQRMLKALATRQAIKTVLNYLSETNGEQHLWLHNWVADNPIPLSGATDADEWLVRLATTPLTKVQDPRRSSVATVAAEAAVLHGEREVSPRDVAERIMALRRHISDEMVEELAKMGEANAAVRRRALELTVAEFKPPL